MLKYSRMALITMMMCSIGQSFAASSEHLDNNHHLQTVIGEARQTHIVVYGDMRFTDPQEHEATNVPARRALVAAIADEAPAAVFLTGDVPWHGGDVNDYAVFKQETKRWTERGIGVWPTLGNHEFINCAESACLDNWWHTFPALNGSRWYSASVGPSLLAIALDSSQSLLDGSEQRQWLTRALDNARSSDRFVLIMLHHPPVADLAVGPMANHNPRPNEIALAHFLEQSSVKYPKLRFVVVAGHIHNYEHLERNGIVYLVSGGGGAKPYAVDRTADDLYSAENTPINFHFLRFHVHSARLQIEMVRLTDALDPEPHQFKVADRIELPAASQNPGT